MEPKKLGKVAKVTGLVLLIGVIAVAVVFIVRSSNQQVKKSSEQGYFNFKSMLNSLICF